MTNSSSKKAGFKNQTGTSGSKAVSVSGSGSGSHLGSEPAGKFDRSMLNLVMHSPKSLQPYSGNARTHSKN